ncbi:4-hydroxythreonine-4-phosphate dehydrogenase PdxA [Flammeovirgaceae bacterium SG7u.111]|nr:4-hydroxythreonine-4-phosphate dehydrogenase PdxA [Flammeovirgaceae bacterium SG7u.132]WPO33100.1 4-hydroxythreonine-4-phosphate dehydrogenase PdxA [Flammeovirgaceae bacterium SG7u.111]
MEKQAGKKPKIGITMGDFNGVGPELIVKLMSGNKITSFCTPIIYGSGKVLTKYKRLLEIEPFNYHQYNKNSYINDRKANVINCWSETLEIEPGKVTELAGNSALAALQKSSEDLKSGFIDAVVTCPINKDNIQSEDFAFPGHTEYYTQTFEAEETLMLMCSDELKVGVVTGHIPLKEVTSQITKELISTKLKILLKTLKKDFGIQKPRVAVLGLNPHAGENGLLGKEDQEVIAPVINDFKNRGNLVFGPFPADGFFGSFSFKKYDAVLAMYHDQGLIPFKALTFDKGINYTAGLPIVRTSPGHGTAYSIAGKGLASEVSLREAIYFAVDIVKSRQEMVESQIRVKVDTKGKKVDA